MSSSKGENGILKQVADFCWSNNFLGNPSLSLSFVTSIAPLQMFFVNFFKIMQKNLQMLHLSFKEENITWFIILSFKNILRSMRSYRSFSSFCLFGLIFLFF
jgi:hypothetical protein